MHLWKIIVWKDVQWFCPCIPFRTGWRPLSFSRWLFTFMGFPLFFLTAISTVPNSTNSDFQFWFTRIIISSPILIVFSLVMVISDVARIYYNTTRVVSQRAIKSRPRKHYFLYTYIFNLLNLWYDQDSSFFILVHVGILTPYYEVCFFFVLVFFCIQIMLIWVLFYRR
jgi:uncharacterized integral membrane protein